MLQNDLGRKLWIAALLAPALVIVLLVALVGHLAGYSEQPGWKQSWSRPLLDELVRWTEPFLPERLSGVQQT